MRPILYKKWISAINTPEYIEHLKTHLNSEYGFKGKYSEDGTNIFEPDFTHKGYFHSAFNGMEDNYCIIETEEGILIQIATSQVKFINPPTDDRLFQASCAAMTGLLSNAEITRHFANKNYEIEKERIAVCEESIRCAKELLKQLNNERACC